jgi:hypothetical protein
LKETRTPNAALRSSVSSGCGTGSAAELGWIVDIVRCRRVCGDLAKVLSGLEHELSLRSIEQRSQQRLQQKVGRAGRRVILLLGVGHLQQRSADAREDRRAGLLLDAWPHAVVQCRADRLEVCLQLSGA